ncbi:hypothetical protein ABFT23_02700 [Nocardioides sp. C4-1]|uniref:hypothetical protein n=1 Tax=Nocardioides sp. C4-1 TaxID=3151851 RepID=UPI00326720C1
MGNRTLVALLAASTLALALTACSDDAPVVVPPQDAGTTTAPAYDPDLEPAAAVMAVVPADATLLEVTDFVQLRLQLGFGELTSRSPADERRRFEREASTTAAMLSRGALRGTDYLQRYGFGQDDVDWEARFEGPSGVGYVVGFRDDLDMAGVQQAAAADDGPLVGATVVPAAHLVAVGATREPAQSWAADPDLLALVGQKAGATYVSRECVPADEAFGEVRGELAPSPAALVGALDPLETFSVSFAGRLVTARLGAPRDDVFERARLGDQLPATDPDFGQGYLDPVADPRDGRIGFTIGDGPLAARLTQDRRLPFAVCSA